MLGMACLGMRNRDVPSAMTRRRFAVVICLRFTRGIAPRMNRRMLGMSHSYALLSLIDRGLTIPPKPWEEGIGHPTHIP